MLIWLVNADFGRSFHWTDGELKSDKWGSKENGKQEVGTVTISYLLNEFCCKGNQLIKGGDFRRIGGQIWNFKGWSTLQQACLMMVMIHTRGKY